jgi:hypothetical protein
MRYIYTTLFVICSSVFIFAQNFEVFALGKATAKSRGMVISEQFMKIQAEEGATEVLAELGSLHSLARGTTAFNHVTNELLIWGKETETSDYQMYVMDATSGKLSQKPIAFKQPPVDIHFDMRQHVFYGIRHSEEKKGLEIIEVDGSMVTSVLDLPEVKSVSLGVTAFNSNNSFYIFAGTDQTHNNRLYVVDIINRQILSSSVISDFYFYELQYDIQDSKLYGLCRKRSNTEQFFFIEIIPSEARPVIISPMTDLGDVGLGGSSFEQKEGLYFFSGRDKNRTNSMYVIDVMSGDIVIKSHPEAMITAMECNNSAFLNAYFEGMPLKNPEVENIEPNKDTREEAASVKVSKQNVDNYQFRVTPTYVLDWMNIDVNIEVGQGFGIGVYDLTDNLLIEKRLFKSENAEDNIVDLSALPAGIYVVKIKTNEQIYSQRIIKR